MVRNRSQREIMDRVSASKARELEQSFFQSHPVLSKCKLELYGIQSLAKKLTSLLVSRIQHQMVRVSTLHVISSKDFALSL